jgi:hypothetical protein
LRALKEVVHRRVFDFGGGYIIFPGFDVQFKPTECERVMDETVETLALNNLIVDRPNDLWATDRGREVLANA